MKLWYILLGVVYAAEVALILAFHGYLKEWLARLAEWGRRVK